MIPARLIFILTGLLLGAGLANAGPPAQDMSAVAGDWKGPIKNGKDDVGVSLDIPKKMDKGMASGSLRFFSPHSCTMKLEFNGLKDGTFYFRAVSPTGGTFCSKLKDGSFTFNASGDFSLTTPYREKINTKFSRQR